MTIAQSLGKAPALDAATQIRRAKGVYLWLWLSPILTLPTLGFLLPVGNLFAAIFFPTEGLYPTGFQPSALLVGAVAVLGSGLWHLVLLSAALDRKSEFARWHGRQALLLAGART